MQLTVRTRLLALGSAVAVAAGISLTAIPAEARVASDKTSKVEADRVDSVPTPKLGWYSCYDTAECATVDLPLDYDEPKGETVEVAVLRVRALDQKNKIGSLFVNPGGPGNSSVQIAANAAGVFGPEVLDKFDIVGMDPRGTNYSDNVQCFANEGAQSAVLEKMGVAFPVTETEQQDYVAGAEAFGKACAKTGQPLAGSMSTAEVARDMDVLRRAVGDKKLSFIGWSYGTYLGQVYANMFPDRVRSVVIDGVLDPIAWAGTKETKDQPQTDRLLSADGATKALTEILKRCDKAGESACSFAAGDPVANFEVLAERLKEDPLAETDPETGEVYTFTYADLISAVLGSLYSPYGYDEIAWNLTDLWELTEPAATAMSDAVERQDLTVGLIKKIDAQETARREQTGPQAYDFPYYNGLEAFTSVLCSDSVNPSRASDWPEAAEAADKRAKYFGSLWIWSSAPCASRTWKATDEDAYRGPFNKMTAAPVLVVGNIWDPSTNYAGAVKADELLRSSRLLSSDSWGHTAYGTSECVDSAVDDYLLTGSLPAKGTSCVGDVQPFEEEVNEQVLADSDSSRKVIAPLRPGLR